VYAIAFDLRGRLVVIAGGGAAAGRKATGLIQAGARVTVVAPSPCAELREAAARGELRLLERPLETSDLDGATVVCAAGDDATANAATVAAAEARHILVDEASDVSAPDATSILTHRVGPLTFSIDTGGAPPVFAARLQRELRERYDERYARAANTLAFARDYVTSVVPQEHRVRVMSDFAERDIDALAAMNPGTVENDVDEAYAALQRKARDVADAPFVQLVCATRASALAMWQTRHVMSEFAQRGLVSTVLQISTKGDRVLDRSLSELGTDGVFVKELESALRDGRADYAVHSCKDLPSTLPDDMYLAAIGPRADARDAFCSERYPSIDALPEGARIGTSSPRRRAQLEALRPDLRFEIIRGNVDTRLRKLRDGEFDAILLAMAGLVRLGLGATYTVALEPDVIVPAVGQGALAIEVRARDAALAERIHSLFADRATELAVTAERAFLRTLQGGCQAPVGAYGTISGDVLTLSAAMAAGDEAALVRGSASCAATNVAVAETLGVGLARRLLGERESASTTGGHAPLGGQLFLLPQAHEPPSQIAPALRGAGAEVIEASDSAAALAQLGGRTPHALLFPSSGSVRAVGSYLASLRESERRPIVAVMGDASSAEASAAGFPPDVVANEPSVGAFVQTITRYVMSKSQP
jgi:hydroxymethylbilane synthase